MTLVDSHRAGRRSIDAAFARTFGVPEATKGVRIDGRTDHAIFTELIVHHRVAGGDIGEARSRLTEAYLAVLEPTLAASGGEVLPGVETLLARLEASHGAVGLATGNIRRGARIKLGHFGLWGRFAAGGFGDDTSVRAEVVRDAVAALAAVLGASPDAADAVVIGDTPLDVEAARAAGARAMGVASGIYAEAALRASGADWVLPDLADTERVVAALGS